MREEKMGRGQELHWDGLSEAVKDYFGAPSETGGRELIPEESDLNPESYDEVRGFVIENTDNPAFEKIVVCQLGHDSKKDRLGVQFEMNSWKELVKGSDDITPEDADEYSREAISKRNEFLTEVTGRSLKNRKQSRN